MHGIVNNCHAVQLSNCPTSCIIITRILPPRLRVHYRINEEAIRCLLLLRWVGWEGCVTQSVDQERYFYSINQSISHCVELRLPSVSEPGAHV